VPGLKCNLISAGQLLEKRYRVSFNNKVYTKNRMFPLVMLNDLSGSLNAYKIESLDESWLWNLRYGHLHFGCLDLLQKKQMVKGLPCIQQPAISCESCILGKHHREKIVSGVSYKAKYPLEIVHTYLCGPMQTPSLTCFVYFMTFIDDFSRKTWLYLLKHKYEAFDVFKKFKSMLENESGRTIKIPSSDKGGQYKLNEFIEFCDLHGIKRHFTARYTPQQNGVDERKNRTIMDMARSMLKEKHLSNEYWGDAVLFPVFILNRGLTKTVRDRVPRESWDGKPCNVSHLRIFGCVAFAHVPAEMGRKLDDKR
jgi:hypothetical protein